MKKVLLFGAGLVTRPLVQYLLDVPDVELTIASRTISKAEKLIGGHERGKAVAWTVDQTDALDELVAAHDLAISLLPWQYHVTVADACIEHGKHMVTTSYVSAAMKERDAAAKEKGITILNEIGLDPGIDHMSAMKIIHDVADKGGKVVSFRSYCGGLPAPEAVTTPWKYKFSWSPRGVVIAGRNNGKFLEDGEIVDIPGEDLFKHHHPLPVEGVGELEGYTNRDCLPYIDLYGLHDAKTMFRGTLRYPGWCDLQYKIRKLGLPELDEMEGLEGMTYAGLVAKLIGASDTTDLRAKVAAYVDEPVDSVVLDKMEWLGLFGDEVIGKVTTPLDAFSELLQKKLEYAPGERDMVALVHHFIAEYPDGKKEKIISTLVDFGIPHGDSSMARTVSLPAAVATRMILEGKIDKPGVHIPVDKDVYEPVLAELETMDIVCKEKVEAL